MKVPEKGSTWKHLKRGSTYTIVGVGTMQVNGDLDNTQVVIYRGYDRLGGFVEFWVRPLDEFMDGRFEPILEKA